MEGGLLCHHKHPEIKKSYVNKYVNIINFDNLPQVNKQISSNCYFTGLYTVVPNVMKGLFLEFSVVLASGKWI
jgi:hypothetical protein